MIREYFKEYKDLCYKIMELEYKIITLKDRLYSISGVHYYNLPKVVGSTSVIHQIQEIDDATEELQLMLKEKKELYLKHMELINRLSKREYISMIKGYYLDEMNMKVLMGIVNTSKSQAYRIKAEAEDEFICILGQMGQNGKNGN